jgi:hypothetical protein
LPSPGGIRAVLSHRQVTDVLFGSEVSHQQTGEPLPDMDGHPFRRGTAGVAGRVVEGVVKAADPAVIGHDQILDVSRSSQRLCQHGGRLVWSLKVAARL